MDRTTLPRITPQLILAVLMIISMVLGPLMIVGAAIAWIHETRQLAAFEVVESSVKSVGQNDLEPTIIQFSYKQHTVTTRLDEGFHHGLTPGDSLTVLYDGKSLPIPNDYSAKHMFSTMLGIAGFVCMAILCLTKLFGRRLIAPNSGIVSFVFDQQKEWMEQLGMGARSR